MTTFFEVRNVSRTAGRHMLHIAQVFDLEANKAVLMVDSSKRQYAVEQCEILNNLRAIDITLANIEGKPEFHLAISVLTATRESLLPQLDKSIG